MTNSFWREVLDHIPGLFLIFRVDENEDAYLIFVNAHIRHILGYKPEEFVLASESRGSRVRTEVDALVEKIAELSRTSKETSVNPGKSEEARPVCIFLSKRAEEYTFYFDFRIFTVKSSPHPFIVVSLSPVSKEFSDADAAAAGSGHDNSAFIAESPLMQALMQKVDALADQQRHLLFRGERSTGKRTLARQLLRSEMMSGAHTEEWNLEFMPVSEQNKSVDNICGNTMGSGSAETGEDMALLFVEISLLTVTNQSKLLEWLRERQEADVRTRILATTSFLLEERMQQGDFSTELYYFLGFDTVLLPPLSQRKEDLRILVSKWTTDVAKTLELGALRVSARVMDQLLDYSWPGNFHEFHEVMRHSLFGSTPGTFRLVREESATEAQAAETGSVDRGMAGADADFGSISTAGDIIPFEEMNRRYLRSVLRKTDGKIYGTDGAARLLGMKPTTLQSKLKKLGVK